MFALPETSLKDSWLTGTVANVPLVNPVIDARIATGPDESKARELRELLELVFEIWKLEFGEPPGHTHGGLLGSAYAGLPIIECPPYACGGASVYDYADLLARLTVEKFEPLAQLDAKAGRQNILACLILSEAAEGRIDSAIKVHWQLKRLRAEDEQRLRGAMWSFQAKNHQFALNYIPFSKGGTSKKGKEYEPKASIRAICRIIGTTAFDDVLDFLKDAERCSDAFHSTNTPINSEFLAVNEDSESIEYVQRGKPPDRAKLIGFGRLRNILTEIKNDP